MRILVACSVDEAQKVSLEGERVRCRPDLVESSDEALLTALQELAANALIIDREPGADVLFRWKASMKDAPVVLVRILPGVSTSSDERLPIMDSIPPSSAHGSPVPSYSVSAEPEGLPRALVVAERAFQERLFDSELQGSFASLQHCALARNSSVLVVGAGVVGLIVAWYLADSGYHVTVLDSGPDPRGSHSWTEYGCSRGGGNARMFTLTEADDYHDKSMNAGPEANQYFDTPPSLHGWDVRRSADRSDHAWIQEFKRIPAWLARGYNHDMFGLNRRSGELWDKLINSQAQLFDDVYLRHDVLRLYEDAEHLKEAAARQRWVGASLAEYDSSLVREQFPALADAVPDAFAGAILVRGFTLNVHNFMTRLLDALELAGVKLHFRTRVKSLRWNAEGQVEGVCTEAEELISSEHFLLSPGAYGDRLLRGTRSDGQIHGVLGCWATVPNLQPRLANSLKVARRGHVAEDANVTVGLDDDDRPVLAVGSGYGWTGADPGNIDQEELDGIHRAVADTVRRLFPRAYEDIGGQAGLRTTQRYCVRPWTASNLGLFEIVPAANGALLVVGGHNTGGFAQAPVIAEAVLHALKGRYHPMHVLYHPERTYRALEDQAKARH